MQPTIHNLIKFCQLEISHKYTNSAVIGGFENMLSVWVPDAKKQNVPLDLITKVEALFKDYDRSTHDQRVETIKNMLTILNKPESAQINSSKEQKNLNEEYLQKNQSPYEIKNSTK